MQAIKLSVGDRIQTKKKHPCSADVFKVLRIGSDLRLICEGCGRDLTLPREKIDKIIKRVLPYEGKEI